MRACFAAGTPLLWEYGSKPIEQFKIGDRVWARDELDADGPLDLKAVEETFVRSANVLHLHVGGQIIRTTSEHPFYVLGKEWTNAGALVIGDLLSTHDGQWVAVEDLLDTGEYETVYNLRVADFHTYFVGSEEWGFSVWAHNANCWNDFQKENKGVLADSCPVLRLASIRTRANAVMITARWGNPAREGRNRLRPLPRLTAW